MAKAFNAGNNIDSGFAAQASTYEAVQKGYMSEDTLDRAVYELFLERMRTGEFDDPSIVGSEALKSYRNHNSSELENEEHIAKAEEAAEKSWVMLKNEDSILPIKKTSDKKVNIALADSRAGSTILGDYSGSPDYTVTPYDGITQELGDNTEVSYLGGFSDSTKLFNLNNITSKLSDGSKVSVKPGTDGYLSGAIK